MVSSVHLFRWVGRIISILLLLLVLLFLVSDIVKNGFGPFMHLSAREVLMFLAFIIILSGLALGLKWEVLGGFLIVCGMAAFYIIDYLLTHSLPRGTFFFVFIIPAILFLYCGFKSRAAK